MRRSPELTSSASISHLRKEDSEFYKGLGILAIVLHNYFHWVAPSPGENEFDFNAERIGKLLYFIGQQPLETPNLLFDYLGHYGVQLFIFLSAYGLTRAYGDLPIRWPSFMRQRIAKIYPTLLLAVLAHALYVLSLGSGQLKSYLVHWVATLSLLSGFIPGMSLSVVGPWWFFSFIFQFYAVFPLLNGLAVRYGSRALLAIGASALAVTYFGNPHLNRLGLEIGFFGTVIGHLPVLCLGIYFARADRLAVDRRLILAAVAIFVAGNWFEPLWYLAPVCIALLLLATLAQVVAWGRAWPFGKRFVAYCGAVSLPLFAVNGFIREPFVRVANEFGTWYLTLTLSAVYLAAALIAAQSLQWLEHTGPWFRNRNTSR
jgi:peptidoglycan/LPS O-acetylase OafA/YrhL